MAEYPTTVTENPLNFQMRLPWLPPKGTIGIFFDAWYRRPILQRVYGNTRGAEFEAAL
jgi:polyphosphate kinase 2 (PPK2 family)